MDMILSVSMRTISLTVGLLCAPAWGADDDTATTTPASSRMPIAAQVLIDHEAQQEAVAKAQYAAQVAKLHAELAKRLRANQDTATKAGDLDGALAIKAEIATLSAPPPIDPATIGSPAGSYAISESDWDITGIEMQDQGHIVKASDGSSGTWAIKDGRLTITWYNGNTNTAMLSDGPMRMQGDRGGTFTITKR
jgi:hypothetical protein